jgi:hypothetical protein
MKTVTAQILFLSAVVVTTCGQAVATLETPYEIEWIRQFGTSTYDVAYGLSADGLGNTYTTGQTHGSLGGPNAGDADAYLSKLDSHGSLLWTRQLGTSQWDWGQRVSCDELGNVYISGTWNRHGRYDPLADGFVRKYDTAGKLVWTHEFGTAAFDQSSGVSVDRLGNVFIGGYTVGSLGGPQAGGGDAFVSKLDLEGRLVWTRQFGTSGVDSISDISADDLGNVCVAGCTAGSLAGASAGSDDAFLAKFDSVGVLTWSLQIGSNESDRAHGVSVDVMGNVYITGETWGSLGGPAQGVGDAFVAKYNASGDLLWARLLGTSKHDKAFDVAVDEFGGVFIAGQTKGPLGGPYGGGALDGFVSKFDSAGQFLWSEQIGSLETDASYGICVDGLGNVYVSGETYGALGGPNAGENDAFLVKLAVPEPGTILLLALGGFGLLRNRRSR